MFLLVVFVFMCQPPYLSACNVEDGVLDLSHSNLLGPINSSVFALCNTTHSDIEEIDMSRNRITVVDSDTFATFYNIKKINLSMNAISNLNKNTFDRQTKLEVLDMSHNSVTKLEKGTFDLFHLKTVYFQNNTISDIEPGVLSEKNENLRYMNLNHNALAVFEPWPYLTKITGDRGIRRVFDIQYNNITHITNKMNRQFNLTPPFEVYVNLQFNSIQNIGYSVIRQLTAETEHSALLGVFLSLRLNATHNPYFCSCDLFEMAATVHSGAFLWTNVEEYRYRCSEPSPLSGTDWFHDLELSELVCNRTVGCPPGCFCQDRPHNDTFYVDCIGAGLTEMPVSIPDHNRSRVELFLDNNNIQFLTEVSYISQIDKLSLSNNKIQTLNVSVIHALSSVSQLDLRFNFITQLPNEIQRFSYAKVQLRGNPLFCDCGSLWISVWKPWRALLTFVY